MVTKKPEIIGKLLLEGNPLTDFRDIVGYINKKAVAEAMKITRKTLDNRLKNMGQFTLENFAELMESMHVEEAKIVEILVLAFKQYLKERKKKPKK